MFGSPWAPSNPYYLHESAWRNSGNISNLALFYDATIGCVGGIKATYGWDDDNARRLGVEAEPGGFPLSSRSLQLASGEYFNSAQFKFGR